MTQVFVLNSAFGVMNAVAAMDAGAIPDAEGPRILLVVNAAAVPEASPSLAETAHLRPLLDRFDRVESLGDLISPALPTRWEPEPEHLPMIERLLRRAWRIGDAEVSLFLQSPQVPPSRTMATVFPGAAVTVVADGLMTYAPMRTRLPESTLVRMTDVVYADIVPGVTPLVLGDRGGRRTAVPIERFRDVLGEVAERATDPGLDALARVPVPTALVLGQYLAALGIVSVAREIAMQTEMVDRAMQWAPERIVFKPHPSAPPSLSEALAARARSHDVDWVVYDGDVPAELVARRVDAVGVVAGFSTALPTVRAVSGTPIDSVGAADLLAGMTPYENSNRMPVVIVDALTRPPVGAGLPALVEAVGYTMQPAALAALRPAAERTLADLAPDERARWFGIRRLTDLRLPGGEGPPGPWTPGRNAVDRVESARLAARGLRRRAGRAWRELKGR